MAAALTYRTLFGLIPTLVLSLIVLRFFYADSIEAPLRRVIDYVGLSDVAIPTQGDESAVGAGEERLGAWIEALVSRVSDINFTAIGAVGVGVLLYAALILMAQVEQSFNVIYKASTSRRLIARVMQYWTLLTLGPLGIVASFWINDQFQSMVRDIGGSAVVSAFGFIAAFFVSWLLLLLAYKVVPNARVQLKPALIGSFVAAALWEVAKWGFGLYVDFSTGYARFYGSLGLIPIFMLWVHITWLVVLFGLELSYALQTLERGIDSFRDASYSRRPETPDPMRALSILAGIADAFEKGDLLTTPEVAQFVGVSGERAQPSLNALEKLGLIHQVERPDDEPAQWSLSRAPEKIQLRSVAESLLNTADENSRPPAITKLQQSLLQGLGDRTLDSMASPSKSAS